MSSLTQCILFMVCLRLADDNTKRETTVLFTTSMASEPFKLSLNRLNSLKFHGD